MSESANITVAVAAAVWSAKGEVLLIRRLNPPRAGQWSLPGGKVERGEALESAVHREIREETGLEVEILGLAGVAEIVDDTALGGQGRHYVLIDYSARALSGEARAASDAADAAWFSPSALAGIELWGETRRIIAESARKHMDISL
jgi:8-oxo-dGTP diphosphatase